MWSSSDSYKNASNNYTSLDSKIHYRSPLIRITNEQRNIKWYPWTYFAFLQYKGYDPTLRTVSHILSMKKAWANVIHEESISKCYPWRKHKQMKILQHEHMNNRYSWKLIIETIPECSSWYYMYNHVSIENSIWRNATTIGGIDKFESLLQWLQYESYGLLMYHKPCHFLVKSIKNTTIENNPLEMLSHIY